MPHQFSGSPVVLPPACFFFPLLFFHCVRGGLWSFFPRRFSSLSGIVPDRKDCAKHAGFEHGQLSQTSVSPCLVQIQNPKSKSKSIFQTSQIPASASTSTPRHTPTDLPASVVSGPPRHIWTDVIRNLPRRAPLLL
ncbi:hypothetical protein V8C34DRAFT_103658 [Trichoderma compactum]